MIRFPEVSLEGVLAVMIDIDNTLYDYDATHEIALAQCANAFLAQCDNVDAPTFKRDYYQHRNRVRAYHQPSAICRSRLLAFLAQFEDYGIKRAWQLAEQFDVMYWQGFYQHMKLLDKAGDLLKSCQQQSIPVCVVSDMLMSVQVRKLQALQCQSAIDYLVCSEEVGCEKPSAKMFSAALSKLQKDNGQIHFGNCIMIGDSLDKDIAGAKALGIKAYQVDVS